MKVLIVIPRAKFNYKAPFMPLGMYSVATYLKEHGHEVTICDRSFEKTSPQELIDAVRPDAVCLTVHSPRVIDDALKISDVFIRSNLPVIWGAGFASDFYKQCLRSGKMHYITIGEGEINTLNLINTLENGGDPSTVKGIAFLKDGEPFKTEPQPLADLADLPVIDFSVYDPGKYLHRYIYCKRMTYLYSSKGCPGKCTFCSNIALNNYCYRVRPIEYVIREIKYLQKNYALDGVYFSDDCWYINKENMYALCEAMEREKIDIKWGCEVRIGIYDYTDLKYMYEHGCRWMFFGVESGSDEMLKKTKKGITTEKARQTVMNCKRAGITSITSYIIGYPDETPFQLQQTIDFAKELDAGVTSFAIFTPIPNSELGKEMLAAGTIKEETDINNLLNFTIGEHSSYVCNTIPQTDLKVIRAWFLWKSFTKKNTAEKTKPFEVSVNAVKDAFDNLTRLGFSELIPGLCLIAKEFFPVFCYAHFYPSVKKKYKLK